ncbi:MAG: hypothetical protein QOF85_1902 [Solirubrobacterales bacterium]|jgi:hypothetical protein|nr:hypothetical protein [Solirubrobacterales bacterium]
MTESPAVAPPTLEEARRWVGHRVDEIGGAEIGRVHGFFADAENGKPSWLIVKQGRFRGTLVAIPIDDCAGGGGRVWVAHERATIRSAPVVDPTKPLLHEHELTICSHYGTGQAVGRAAAVAGRKEGAVTSQPAA